MQEMGPWAGGVTLQGPVSVTPTRDSESQTGGVGAAVQRASRGAGWLMVQQLGSPARPKRSAPGEAWTPSALAVYFFLGKKKKKKASCGLPTSWSGNFYLKRLRNCTKFSLVSPLPEDGRSFIFRSIFAPLSSPLHRLLPATALDKDVNPQSAELACTLV